MAEPQTIGVQVKNKEGTFTGTGILRNEADEIVLRTEQPKMELHFNYVPFIEFLFKVEQERKKVKLKQM